MSCPLWFVRTVTGDHGRLSHPPLDTHCSYVNDDGEMERQVQGHSLMSGVLVHLTLGAESHHGGVHPEVNPSRDSFY